MRQILVFNTHVPFLPVKVCWLIQLLKKLTEDGATLSLLLRIRSLACRSRGTRKIGQKAFAQGEKLVAIYTCCRYGPNWGQWRVIARFPPEDGNEATLDLGLDASLKITSVTGISYNEDGFTSDGEVNMFRATLSDGTIWGPHGKGDLRTGETQRPSPSSPPMALTHLSGDETEHKKILRFHWMRSLEKELASSDGAAGCELQQSSIHVQKQRMQISDQEDSSSSLRNVGTQICPVCDFDMCFPNLESIDISCHCLVGENSQ